MANVYVVTEGEYSDYTILAVFSSLERAHDYVRGPGGEDAGVRVEEYELDDDGGERHHRIYSACIDLATGDGLPKVESYWEEHGGYWRLEVKGWRGEALVGCGWEGLPFVRGESSIDEEHALKLAAECRQKWLREVQPLPKDFDEYVKLLKKCGELVVKDISKP